MSTPAARATSGYVRYHETVEKAAPDEEEIIDKLIEKLRGNSEYAYKKFHHGLRDAHAKSHGILRGDLHVYPDLAPELRQGLFATAASFPVIARLSTTSGALRSDLIPGIRGLGVKILNVEGDRILEGDTDTTQDLLMVTHREFPFPDVQAYLGRGMFLAFLLSRLPDPVMNVATGLLGKVQPMLRKVGLNLPHALLLFAEPVTHILGQTFFSGAPIRYGEYIAKFYLEPVSPEVAALKGRRIDTGAGEEVLRDLVSDFFANQSAEYELRVQLCTDLDAMPIEDAGVEWPEALSPYRSVAKIVFGVQDTYSRKRQVYGDDVLSFNSWKGIAAHQPLGSINRLKLRVYEASSNYRHQVNKVERREPASTEQLPE
ncbi:MAG: catalase family protein [Mycobacterium sp.]